MKASIQSVTCACLLLAAGATSAGQDLPADPTGKPNEMITKCMTQQDPAMKKEDALQICKEKMKQGVDVDKKPKEPEQKTPPK
jgi:hypothetical protein